MSSGVGRRRCEKGKKFARLPPGDTFCAPCAGRLDLPICSAEAGVPRFSPVWTIEMIMSSTCVGRHRLGLRRRGRHRAMSISGLVLAIAGIAMGLAMQAYWGRQIDSDLNSIQSSINNNSPPRASRRAEPDTKQPPRRWSRGCVVSMISRCRTRLPAEARNPPVVPFLRYCHRVVSISLMTFAVSSAISAGLTAAPLICSAASSISGTSRFGANILLRWWFLTEDPGKHSIARPGRVDLIPP